MTEPIKLPQNKQAIIDEQARGRKMVPLLDVLNIVKSNFNHHHNQLEKQRTIEEQTIIGGVITVIELELKKDLKELDKEEPS